MNSDVEIKLKRRLIAMVLSSHELMAALRAVRDLELVSWCIGAGAVRSMVWDRLHGYAVPTSLDDIDVVYFEDSVGPERDAELERRLRLAMPNLVWEVTNQATVHCWFQEQFSQEVAPLKSLEEGVATWPEYATCVGVTLNHDDSVGITAPHGLGDLFGLLVRHNPVRAGKDIYWQRVVTKRFRERWPLVSIIPV
ncbi:nucleotidyltransferase family protein [Rhodoferax sp.]|uniref:nucleotidyltransferase family protein n=1 Tax=Rhodoferax sp. TaxID=50421 RepID=UPI0034498CA0